MIRTLTSLAVALGLNASLLVAQDFEFNRDLARGSRFVLRNIMGDVRVEAGSGRALSVTARKKPGRQGDPDDVEIKSVEIDGGVAICVYYPSSGRSRNPRRDDGDRGRRRDDDPCSRGSEWQNNDRNDTSIDFTIRLPADLRVDAKTVAGDFIGSGLRGTLDVGTVSGDLRLTDVEGDVLEAASVSGDIELDRVRMREIGAETVSGDVTFTGSIDPKGRYEFKTLSGDVVMTLPREPDATVSAVTFSGDLDSVFPIAAGGARSRRHRFSATWGTGTAQLDLESFSGDIRIRQAN
jgi:hypothetical protein